MKDTENDRERIEFGGVHIHQGNVDLKTSGVKFDSGKPMMELLSARWLIGVAQVLTFGAKKYAAHNWRNGIAQSRLIGAALRHIFAYLGGEDLDPETKLPHLHHASCCLMFASELRETRPDLDDRYKEPGKPIEKEHACL